MCPGKSRKRQLNALQLFFSASKLSLASFNALKRISLYSHKPWISAQLSHTESNFVLAPTVPTPRRCNSSSSNLSSSAGLIPFIFSTYLCSLRVCSQFDKAYAPESSKGNLETLLLRVERGRTFVRGAEYSGAIIRRGRLSWTMLIKFFSFGDNRRVGWVSGFWCMSVGEVCVRGESWSPGRRRSGMTDWAGRLWIVEVGYGWGDS
jgi:hypothetical protein